MITQDSERSYTCLHCFLISEALSMYRLCFSQTIEQSLLIQKFLRRSRLCDAALFQDNNLIDVCNRPHTVRNNQYSFPLQQHGQCLLNQVLILRIHGSCGFVQNNYRRILQDRPGDRDTLPLAS